MPAESRLRRQADSVRSRLLCAVEALDLTIADPDAEITKALRSVLDDAGGPPEARAAAVILAVTGRYPSSTDLDTMSGCLATGDVDQAWSYALQLAAGARRRAVRRRAVRAPDTVVDLTRTSRASEISGIPRVATALAHEAVRQGAGLVVWEAGAPGDVTLDDTSRVAFPAESWRRGRLLRRLLQGVKRVYWGLIGWMSRWQSGYRAARALRSATAPLGDLLFGRAVPVSLLVLGPGHYVSPEVNRPDVVDRLVTWRRAQPALRVTVVLHDLLPLVNPEFFAPDQRVEHVEFIRLVAVADDVVVASPHLIPEVDAVRLLHGGTGGRPVRVVSYGISTSTWVARPTAAYDRPELVMVGSMELRKNHVLALCALGALARAGRPTVLHVIGNARPVHPLTRDALARARALGVTVVEHRGLDDDGMLGLMANARAALYLSWAEGFGLPVLEALSAGLPVFASDIPPHRAHLRYGGVVLVPPNRPDVLRDRLAEYLDNPAVEARLRAEIRPAELPAGYAEWVTEVLAYSRDAS